MKEFELVQELFGHTADVRCACILKSDGTSLVTGSRDRSVRLWQPNEAQEFVQVACNENDHPHWVNALESLIQGGFATGCHDHIVRIFTKDCVLLSSLSGHTGPVSSLSEHSSHQLLSGSWDGSCRVWDLESNRCIKTLGDQENSVSVLSLNSDSFVCGSAGRAQGNVIVDSTLRVFSSKTFDKMETLKPHQGPIRCLSKASALSGFFFASASNDGSVILYDDDFHVCRRLFNPPGFEQTPAFVYCVNTLLPDAVITACDDSCVRIWNDSTIAHELEHPSTVWWVSRFPESGDLVTTSGDGIVRIFSQTPRGGTKDLNLEFKRISRQAREAQRNKVNPSSSSAMDVSKLVRIEDAAVKEEGHVQVFNKQGVAVAYQVTQGVWVEIGPVVTSNPDKEELNGEWFDKVIPVEIEDTVQGGIKKVQLGFNHSDNPHVIANAFIKLHQLPDDYLNQIVDFIQHQQVAAPPAAAAAQSATPPPPNTKRCFPLETFVIFEKGDFEKAASKLGREPELGEIVSVLKATSRYHANTLTSKQFSVVLAKLDKLPRAEQFMAYDLLRAMCLHPSASTLLAAKDCERLFSQACLAATSVDTTKPLILCALRMCCNLFRLGDPVVSSVLTVVCQEADTRLETVVQKVMASAFGKDPSVRMVVSCLLVNCAWAVFKKRARASQDTSLLAQCVRGAQSLLLVEDDATFRNIQTLGCAALVEKSLVNKNMVETSMASSQRFSREWKELWQVLN